MLVDSLRVELEKEGKTGVQVVGAAMAVVAQEYCILSRAVGTVAPVGGSLRRRR